MHDSDDRHGRCRETRNSYQAVTNVKQITSGSIQPSENSTNVANVLEQPHNAPHTELDRILLSQRPYLAAERHGSRLSFDSTAGEQKRVPWSYISTFSVAELSNISVLELPLVEEDLFRSNLWMTFQDAATEANLLAFDTPIVAHPLLSLLKQSNLIQDKSGGANKMELQLRSESEYLCHPTWIMHTLGGVASMYDILEELDKEAILSTSVVMAEEQTHSQCRVRAIVCTCRIERCYECSVTLDEAEVVLLFAMGEYEKAKDLGRASRCQYQLGRIYLEARHDFAKTKEMFKRAIKGFRKVGDDLSLCLSLYELGRLYERRNESDKAGMMLIQAIEMFEKIRRHLLRQLNEAQHKATVDKRLWDTYYELQDIKWRITKRRKENDIPQGKSDGHTAAKHKITLHRSCALARKLNQSLTYKAQSKIIPTEDWLMQPLAGSCVTQNHLTRLRLINSLGILCMNEKLFERAEIELNSSLDGFSRTLGLAHELTISAQHDLGRLHYHQGELYEAEHQFALALDGYILLHGWCHNTTLRVAFKLGAVQRENYKLIEAEGMLTHVLDTCAQVPDFPWADHVVKELQLIYYELDGVYGAKTVLGTEFEKWKSKKTDLGIYYYRKLLEVIYVRSKKP